MFPDKLRVSSFLDRFPHYVCTAAVSPLRLRWVQDVCLFRCNLPPAPLAQWLGSFTCHCGNSGVEQTPNKSQHTKLTLGKKILPPLLQGFELATFQSWVRRSYQQAIPVTVNIHRCKKKGGLELVMMYECNQWWHWWKEGRLVVAGLSWVWLWCNQLWRWQDGNQWSLLELILAMVSLNLVMTKGVQDSGLCSNWDRLWFNQIWSWRKEFRTLVIAWALTGDGITNSGVDERSTGQWSLLELYLAMV